MSYRVELFLSDGYEGYLDDVFETEEEAEEAGCNALSDYSCGAEVLEMGGHDFTDPVGSYFEIEEI